MSEQARRGVGPGSRLSDGSRKLVERWRQPPDRLSQLRALLRGALASRNAFDATAVGLLGEWRSATPPPAILDGMTHASLRDETRKALAMLSPREEQVLRLRFGIGESADHTLEEIGQRFELTRQRIRQIEARALRKLRQPVRNRELKAFSGGSANRDGSGP